MLKDNRECLYDRAFLYLVGYFVPIVVSVAPFPLVGYTQTNSSGGMAPVEMSDALEKQDIPSIYAQYFYISSKLYEKAKIPDKAILDLLAALKMHKDAYILYYDLAGLLSVNLRFEHAEKALQESIDIKNDFIPAYILLGKLQLEIFRKYDNAVICFRKALEYEPNNIVLLLYLSYTYALQDDIENSLKLIQAILLLDPYNVLALNFGAELYFSENDFSGAQLFLERSLEIQPNRYDTLWYLAECHENKDESEKALKYYIRLYELNPDKHQLLRKIGDMYLAMNARKKAFAAYQEALLYLPDDPGLAMSLGYYYYLEKQYRKSEEYFKKLLAKNPDISRVRYLLSMVYEGMGDGEQALAVLIDISLKEDLYEDYCIRKSWLYFTVNGDFTTAEQYIAGIRQMVPDSLKLTFFHANLFEMKNMVQEAIDVLGKALIFHPRDPKILFKIGALFDKLGNKQEMIASMQKVLEIDPDDVEALNYLGYTFAEMRINLDQAERMLKRAISLRPNDPFIIDSIGWVYYRMGRYTEALHHLKTAHELMPEELTVVEHYGDVLLKLGRKSEALIYYRKVQGLLNKNPDSSRSNERRETIETKIRRLTIGR